MADNPTPHRDIKLGTAANAPEKPAVDPKTDTSRYYYPPGTTEPVLRPEVAPDEPATDTTGAKPASTEDKSQSSKPWLKPER
jgi:hypothetical protein